MSDLSALRNHTRQALGLARARVLAQARVIVETSGPQAVRITVLAREHSVAPLTVRRWLSAAGFDLSHLARGRPRLTPKGE